MPPPRPAPDSPPGAATTRCSGVASLVISLVPVVPLAGHAHPDGFTVQSGQATATVSGSQLQITASHNAQLHWQSFHIAPGETTSFVQPSAASVVWNHIHAADPSRIEGNLTANGVVVLVHPAGFHFGPDSFVSAAGLVVSTAPPVPTESGGGLFWQFSGPPPEAAIVNYGRLQAHSGGSAFLIADRIENHGTIAAPNGTIGLAAGREVLLSERPDGRGLSAEVRLPAGSIDNSGRLVADAGAIALQARVVHQNGLVQANSVRERHGIIELVASDSALLGPDSVLSAAGSSAPDDPSDGGRITVRSERSLVDSPASTLSVDGARGGTVALSAPELPAIHSVIQARGATPGTGGRLVIDPTDIVLGNGGSDSAGTGTVPAEAPPSTLRLDVHATFLGFSRIVLQATRNITLEAGVAWDLAESTGVAEPGSLLQLEAGNNITLANGSSLLAGDHWSISLQAGRDFATPDAVKTGTGSILLSGSASIQSRDGGIRLLAGQNITAGSGFVRTTAGGDLHAHAVAGSINTGTRQNGFQFRPTGYFVDPDLGGFSTAAGGDVTLRAGQDVLAYLPLAGGIQTDAGSGAFGAEPGRVTVAAGRDVAGHFVVRNGEGSIQAGRNAGTTARLLALSLVDGGWTVEAGLDVLLQEIRNPNGLFNNLGATTAPFRHRFDYAPDAFATLRAGQAIQLRGTALPRFGDAFSQGMPPIYPGSLTLEAGAGGIELGNDLILFPSPRGNLDITTTEGGSLRGTKTGDLTQLVLSDSAKTHYRTFGDFGLSDRSPALLHLDDPEPVRLAIAGDVSGILLGVPKRAEIQVGGSLVNTRFDGQNLGVSDVTRLHVAGDILNRNEFTSVPLDQPPDFSAFDLGLIYPPPTGNLAGIQNRFSYQPRLRQLSFQGRMTGEELQFLLATPVQVLDPSGAPVIQPNGEPLTRATALIPADVVQRLYDLSQDVPLNPDTGYRLGGPGRFEITARNLELGATAGIVSQGPRANAGLARLFDRGADLVLALAGNLSMFSTRIASLSGGDIDIHADGSILAGSRDFTPTDATPRGIYTVDPSDVTVIARGDIAIHGSRIAAYDGGNVTVRSLEGSIDAGSGSSGSATVEKIHVDPVTRRVLSYSPTIPGSGILATTFPPPLDPAFPPSRQTVGDILVETPRGNIVASAGGVVQIPLNGLGASAGTVTLRAGTRDASGQVVHVGNIDASGSGVIGSTVKLEASGGIQGLVFARENIDLSAVQSVAVTALAQGNVSVSSGGNVSGTIIGVGSVQASGASVDAALLSQNVTASGDVSSSQVGFAQGAAANNASQAVQADDSNRTPAEAAERQDDDLRKSKTPAPRLVRTVGRVTVLLPDARK